MFWLTCTLWLLDRLTVYNRTIIRRGDMTKHLLSCQHSSMPSEPPLSGLLITVLSEPSLPPAALSTEPSLPPDVLCSVSKQSSESLVEHSFALPSVLNETVAYGKSIKMKCPHCVLSLLKIENFKAHMMKRDSSRSLDVHPACRLSVELWLLIAPILMLWNEWGLSLTDVSTYHRLCPQCHMVYRYQEWTDRFNNHIDWTSSCWTVLCKHEEK